jgi:hypothetical protein
MDGRRFDAWVQGRWRGPSRRSLLLAAVTALTGAPALLELAAAQQRPGQVEPETHPGPGCKPVTLVLLICAATKTGHTPGPYNGAPVTVETKGGTIIFAGFNSGNGRVIVGTVDSGKSYKATVGAVLQPVPFPGGGVDFVEMAFNTNDAGDPKKLKFKVPCEESDGGGLNQVSVVTLKPQQGEIRGELRESCASTATVPNRLLELFTTAGESSPGGPPHKAKKIAEEKTSGDGSFVFKDLDPCQIYRLKFKFQNLAREIEGLLAGTNDTTLGTPDEKQLYLLNAGVTTVANGICDVRPDPP